MLGSIKYLMKYKNPDGKRISKDQQKTMFQNAQTQFLILSDSEPEKN